LNLLSLTTRLSDAARLAAGILGVCLLQACAEQTRAPHTPDVETGTPNWSQPAEADKLGTPNETIPGLTRVGSQEIELALVEHRSALLNYEENTLPSGEKGYYLDTLEARLIQLLRGSDVKFQRDENRFAMHFAGGNNFATNTAQLTEAATLELRPVMDVLVEYDRTQVLVFGYTDDVGDAAYNQDLSDRRALAVARLLVQAGVDPRRILVAGLGEENPVASNETDAGRARNRRVELVVEPLVR
jgi:outer membrane protein OmpA-like peptidoglycan-associated protein